MPAFVHTLRIERASSSAEDDYGQPVTAYATLADVPGLIQPRTQREVALASQAGAAVGDHVIFLARRDLTAADRIRDITDSETGPLYQVVGIRDFHFGALAHLEVDARRVTSDAVAVGS